MIKFNQFQSLNLEKKREYLALILLPKFHDPEDNEILERVILQTTEDEILDFYNVLIDPSKIDTYVEKVNEAMKNNNDNLKELSKLLQIKNIQLEENKDNKPTDLDNMLEDI